MITPRRDGRLTAAKAVDLPLSTARLQATAEPKGIVDLFLWGNGVVGSALFSPPIPERAVSTTEPNRIIWTWDEGEVDVSALPGPPAIVVRYRGRAPFRIRLVPSRKRYAGLAGDAERRPVHGGIGVSLPQGVLWAVAGPSAVRRGLLFELRDGAAEMTLLVGCATDAELDRLSQDNLSEPSSLLELGRGYSRELLSRFSSPDPVLNTLFAHSLHAALSSVKRDEHSRFAGLSAGFGYALPARSYYRDGYWTVQILLAVAPELVREEILLLASGVLPDGECPSGVIIPTAAGLRFWEEARAGNAELARDHRRVTEWWSDHFDSPLYFALMVLEYLQWTGDRAILRERVHDWSVKESLGAALRRYAAPDAVPGLRKPLNDHDWADNVFRDGLVTYDLALAFGALTKAGHATEVFEPAQRAQWLEAARRVETLAREHLWNAARGAYFEYVGDDASEDHVTMESLTTIRFGLADASESDALLRQLSRSLESRHNPEQPYGDWGILCCYPPYRHPSRLRGKTRFPFRYHNGSDWPYWDGVYADILLRRRDPEWRYALTKWWTHSLEQGWTEPVEYYSPPWGRGSPLQAWSSMAAAAMVCGGFGFGPGDTLRVPPWSDSRLKHVMREGRRFDVIAEGNDVRLEEA